MQKAQLARILLIANDLLNNANGKYDDFMHLKEMAEVKRLKTEIDVWKGKTVFWSDWMAMDAKALKKAYSDTEIQNALSKVSELTALVGLLSTEVTTMNAVCEARRR